MASLTVRNVPDEVHRALRVRAAEHGRSTEAEVSAILAESAMPPNRPKLGDAIAAISRRHGLTDEDVSMLTAARDTTPVEPITLP